LAEYIYDELIGIDTNKRLQPGLAESWTTSKDGLTVTLKLRKGVSFVDGTPFDSAAVKATLERGKTMVDTKAAFSTIASIEAPDANTAVLHLTQPDSSLLFSLATPIVGAGTTGYKVVSFAPPGASAKLIVERAPGFKYWDPKMWRIKRFEVQCGVLDGPTAMNGLKTGAFDYIYAGFITTTDVKTGLAGATNLQILPFGALRFQSFVLNQTTFPDVKVRTAIMQSLDLTTLAKSGAIPGLECTDPAGNQVLFSNDPGYVKGFKSPLDYSAKAQAAAAAVLIPLHLNFDLWYRSARADTQAEAEFVQQALKAVGVTVNLKSMPSTQLQAAFSAGALPAMLYAISSAADPTNFLNTLMGSSQGGAGPSFTTVVKPKLDEINAQPVGSAARAQKLTALNKFLLDQAWVRPFCTGGFSVAAVKTLHGIPDMPYQWTVQSIPRSWYFLKPA
jgi:peptide/nickel transport system substrate-binding protein